MSRENKGCIGFRAQTFVPTRVVILGPQNPELRGDLTKVLSPIHLSERRPTLNLNPKP